MATGSRRTPAESALYPRTNWKNWVIRKMNPNNVKKATDTEALAALKRGLANSRTSSIGTGARRSLMMNAASSTALTANPVIDWVEVQPRSGASMMV